MADVLRTALNDSSIPEIERNTESWPSDMRNEWGCDEGVAAAAIHRKALIAGFRHLRARLDEFDPEVVIIIGDDQYENFREDIIPPYSVLAYDDMTVYPWRHAQASSDMTGKPNVWNEGPDTARLVRGAPALAREIASGLLSRDFDAAYAYRPLHHPGLAHAFLNSILYIDWDREGFDYPTIPIAVNCYGSAVVSRKGFLARLDDDAPADPPSPSPGRLFALGAALAEVIEQLGVRAAVVASSSWSHAFLCDKTSRLRPDIDSDRWLYDRMIATDWDTISNISLSQLVDAGQQEVLNWMVLWGLAQRAGMRLEWSTFVETHVFNSNKVFAEYIL
jgi:hypothetical protein